MAARTIAGRLQAVVRTTVRYCCTTDLFRVAAQAERTRVTEFEHVPRRTAVLLVTCRTTVDRARIMFVHEGAALILMAGYAKRLRIGAQLMRLITAVRIVAACAIHDAFLHAMVRRLVEVGARRLMAGEAQLTLGAAQHSEFALRCHMVLVFRGGMDFVAGRASNTGARMLTQTYVALFAGTLVAFDTRFGEFVWGQRGHTGNRAFCSAGFEMLCDISMALLARFTFCPALRMSGTAPGRDFILMAFGARLRARRGFDGRRRWR